MKIPRQDWDRPPYNRWTFQHVREILPTTEVWRGTTAPQPWPRQHHDLSDLKVKGVAGDAVPLEQLLEETFTDGFLVIRGGTIVYERYFNGMAERSLHLSQSVAKSFTGALAGILVHDGLLDVTAPVTQYLPELAQTAWQGASLQQVLDMTTGVKFSEDYTDPLSDIGRVDVASGWKAPPPSATDPAEWPGDMWSLILGFRESTRPHGAAFEYRSIETDVLALAMERVTGKRLAQLLSEHIWQKAGMEHSANFTVDPAGYAIADGGLNACLRDYGRFGQLSLDGGGGIIPTEWIEATRNADHSQFGAPYSAILPQGAYHNQFWIEDQQSKSLLARGVFGQLIYVSWAYDMVVVKLSTWPDFINGKFTSATLAACHTIGQHRVT